VRLLVSLAGVLALVVAVPSARADGDPASDVLVTGNVFLPYPAPSKAAASALAREVAAAYSRGYRLKVAVIAGPMDLGAIPSLFGRPADYARFLGQELQFVYVGPLLIVMPAGFGIYDGGRSTQAEERVLARARVPGTSADALTTSAARVVHELVAAGALRSKDIKAPYAGAVTSSGRRGSAMKLHYVMYDDSGRSRAEVSVLARAGHVVARLTVPFRTVRVGESYSLAWRVPARPARAPLSFCIVAFDPSGNRSRRSCASLHVL
jgi:hypothetical protein